MHENTTSRVRGTNRRPALIRLLALLAALALVAAACGDSDDDDGDAGTSETTEAATAETEAPADTEAPAEEETAETEAPADTEAPAEEASGEPIRVMTSGPIESPVFSLPSIPVGAQIAVDEINAAGGVNGRPLELIACNDEANPNLATGCVQQAIDEGVVAFVGGLSIFAANVLPLSASENLSWLGLSAAGTEAEPNNFPFAADGTTVFASAGAAAVESGCANVGVFTSVSAVPSNEVSIVAGVESFGGTVASRQQGTGGDFAPLVEAAIAEGAECIASGVSPGETGPLVGAVAGRLPIFTIDGSLPVGLVVGLGEAANGITITGGFLPPGAGNARIDGLAAASAEIDPMVSLDQFWYSGYAGVYAVAEVLSSADEVSAAAVSDGVRDLVAFDTGLGPVLDFSSGIGVAGFENLFNTEVYVMTAQDGAYVLAQDETLDMLPAIELISQG